MIYLLIFQEPQVNSGMGYQRGLIKIILITILDLYHQHHSYHNMKNYTIQNNETITQDFTVLDVSFTDYSASAADNNFQVLSNVSGVTGSTFPIGQVDMRQYNKILVHPDPSTLVNQIPSGSIYEYTHRKRKNADNVVNAISSPLEGTNGAETYSGGGYIIPNDLTVTQKRNIDTLITQLKAKNNFRDDGTE